MKTERYQRKPFYVDVVQVTDENFDEVCEWVQGGVNETPAGRYIQVNVVKPLNPRQSKAYVGDFILKGSTGFKVFTKAAFEVSFMPAPQRPDSAKKNSRSPRGSRTRTSEVLLG